MNRTRIHKTVRSAAAAIAVLAMSAHISGGAQATPALVAYWDFDDTSNPQVTRDKLYGVEGDLEGGAAFTTGRSGAPGDNALDFGTTSAGQVVRVTNVDFLNQAASDDQITISFWQNLYSIASTSAFWGVSPSSDGDQRGIQVHTPWGDNNIYYDTAGCCDGATQRISGNVVDFEPNFGAGWHHITVIKNGSNKQIWINGNLFLDGNNTSPLPVDFVRLMIGGDLNAGNSLQGIMDDFAVFDGVLSADQIAALASGTAPDELSGIEIMTRPLVSAAMGTTTGFSIGITESPALPIDVESVQVQFNGESVSADVNQVGNVTTISYDDPDTLLAPSSTHEVTLMFQDSEGVAYTETRSFTVIFYAIIPGDWQVSNPSEPGMTVRVYHTALGRVGGNFIWGVENALAGKFIDPETGEPHLNLVTPDLWETDVVNWEQNGGDITVTPENGPDFFNSARPPGNPRFNTWVPGVFISDPDNIATETFGYIELPAGFTDFGVTSDDGFRLSIFSGLNDVRGSVLGQFDGGRGATESRFTVLVEEAGVYPFRLTWWEGGGGASVEWYSFHPTTDERILVNDPQDPNALRTYRTATGGSSVISKFYPFNGSETVAAGAAVEIRLRNGQPAVNQGSIELLVDGTAVTPEITSSGGEILVSYLPAGGWPFGRTLTLDFSYGVTGGNSTRTVTSVFTTAVQGPNDLPAQGAFVIEAEDWNYDNGQHMPEASTMPYLGGAYNGRGSTRNIDFWNNDGNDSNSYNRTGFDPEEPERTHYINNVDNLGARHGQQRPGFQVTENYRIGWVGTTDWNNYTRNIPAGFYNVFAAMSFDGTAADQMRGTLFRVTSDPTQPNQTTQQLGSFSGPGSGGWGPNDLVMMRNAAGEPAVVRIEGGGPTTLRFNMDSGDFDWFVLTVADEVPPQLVSMSPMNGWTIRQGTAITVVLEDGADALSVEDFSFFLNDQEVAADISRDGSLTTISFVPQAPFGTQHSYRVEYPGGQASASFFISPLGASGLFAIEAEDFNFGGGETLAEASEMPYLGGAFAGLGGVAGVDYASNQNPEDTAQIYRDAELSPPMHFSEAPGTVDRGTWELETNFRIGWAGTAVWGNYTRNIPDGEYQVWAALSYGGGTAANQSRATLARVTSNPAEPDQTLEPLGSFSGPGTGGWGLNNLIPLLDGEGAMTTVMLGGTQTLRVTLDSGDLDYIVLHRVGDGSGEPGEGGVVNIGVNAQGDLVLTWEEGELKSASSIFGPFEPVQGATSPHTVQPSGSQMFFIVE